MDKFESILKESTARINNVVDNQLLKYKFFKDTNFKKNIESLKKVLCDDATFMLSSPIAYFSKSNLIVVNTLAINQETITVEDFSMLYLHELIHMASTNRDNNNIGYISSDNGYPKIYTEAATQYLTLKLLYGDNLKEAIDKNYVYPEAVKLFSKMVEEVGEEVLYNGFFEADPNKHRKEIPFDKILEWGNLLLQMIDLDEQSYCEELDKSYEEAINKEIKKGIL